MSSFDRKAYQQKWEDTKREFLVKSMPKLEIRLQEHSDFLVKQSITNEKEQVELHDYKRLSSLHELKEVIGASRMLVNEYDFSDFTVYAKQKKQLTFELVQQFCKNRCNGYVDHFVNTYLERILLDALVLR